MAPRNFVLLFREREGSSAIIDLLRRHPQVHVPVFEELDEYEAHTRCTHGQIARLAGLTLQTGDFDRALRLLAEDGPPEPAPAEVVGFKWRIWGQPDRVVEMLAAQQVAVFHLFRLQLDELAASKVFTETVIPALEQQGEDLRGGGHLQFALAAMTEAERVAFQQRLAAIRFRIDPARMLAIAQDLIAFKRQVHADFLRPLQARGVVVHSLAYEDFVGDRNGFLRAVCGVIGVDAGPLQAAETMYRKVNRRPLSGQVENWAEARRDPALRETMAGYRDLIMREHAYLPPARP